jgi:hypothetical protein
MEQMMLQIWLGGLKNKLKAGEVESVIEELTIALTRIEEDRDGGNNDNDGQDRTFGRKGSGDTLAIARPEAEHTGRLHEGDADATAGEDKQPSDGTGEAPSG